MRYTCLATTLIVLFALAVPVQHWDRSLGLRNTHYYLATQGRHLRTIAGYVRDYHSSVGRWPTNDEGLAVVSRLLEDCGRVERGEGD